MSDFYALPEPPESGVVYEADGTEWVLDLERDVWVSSDREENWADLLVLNGPLQRRKPFPTGVGARIRYSEQGLEYIRLEKGWIATFTDAVTEDKNMPDAAWTVVEAGDEASDS